MAVVPPGTLFWTLSGLGLGRLSTSGRLRGLATGTSSRASAVSKGEDPVAVVNELPAGLDSIDPFDDSSSEERRVRRADSGTMCAGRGATHSSQLHDSCQEEPKDSALSANPLLCSDPCSDCDLSNSCDSSHTPVVPRLACTPRTRLCSATRKRQSWCGLSTSSLGQHPRPRPNLKGITISSGRANRACSPLSSYLAGSLPALDGDGRGTRMHEMKTDFSRTRATLRDFDFGYEN